MAVNVPTCSEGVCASVSIVSVGSPVSADEEDKQEDEESAHVDDEEEVDEIKTLDNDEDHE